MAEDSGIRFAKDSQADFKWLAELLGKSGTNLSAFMVAMSIGFAFGQYREEKYSRSTTGPRTEIRPRHQVIMSAIQAHHLGESAALDDHGQRDEVAARFAEGGIRFIREELKDSEDPFNSLLVLLSEAASKPARG